MNLILHDSENLQISAKAFISPGMGFDNYPKRAFNNGLLSPLRPKITTNNNWY